MISQAHISFHFLQGKMILVATVNSGIICSHVYILYFYSTNNVCGNKGLENKLTSRNLTRNGLSGCNIFEEWSNVRLTYNANAYLFPPFVLSRFSVPW